MVSDSRHTIREIVIRLDNSHGSMISLDIACALIAVLFLAGDQGGDLAVGVIRYIYQQRSPNAILKLVSCLGLLGLVAWRHVWYNGLS